MIVFLEDFLWTTKTKGYLFKAPNAMIERKTAALHNGNPFRVGNSEVWKHRPSFSLNK